MLNDYVSYMYHVVVHCLRTRTPDKVVHSSQSSMWNMLPASPRLASVEDTFCLIEAARPRKTPCINF